MLTNSHIINCSQYMDKVKMKPGNFPGLDSLDIKLIRELEADARQTHKSIATNLNIARSTVSARIQRLLDNNIISIICWADPQALGYKLIVSFGISTQPGHMSDVADRLAACPPVLHVHLCTGRFDIIAWALFRNNEELTSFLSNELGSISGIMQIDKMITLNEVKVSSTLLKNEQEPRHQRKNIRELDDLDILLIRELQINPRQRPDFLSRKFGLYESTIRRRIQRLIDGNVIRIRAIIDPVILGYVCAATIGLTCNPDKIREVAESVASYNNVQYISICIGRYDIDIYVVFRKFSDLENFISVDLGSIPGLIHMETAMIHKVVKTLYQIPV
jgi:Lrp/AsnC family transcriptional regulator for asnA, asnC and gidA